jgi:hypothetical protein
VATERLLEVEGPLIERSGPGPIEDLLVDPAGLERVGGRRLGLARLGVVPGQILPARLQPPRVDLLDRRRMLCRSIQTGMLWPSSRSATRSARS